MKTAALILVLSAAVALACTGCVSFRGNRDITFKWSGFGTSVDYASKVAGTYGQTVDAAAVETPTAR